MNKINMCGLKYIQIMKQIECAHKNKELLKNEDGRLKDKGDKDKSNGEQLVKIIVDLE